MVVSIEGVAAADVEGFLASLTQASETLGAIPARLEAARVHDTAFGKLVDAAKVRDAYHQRLPATEQNIAEACELIRHLVTQFGGTPGPVATLEAPSTDEPISPEPVVPESPSDESTAAETTQLEPLSAEPVPADLVVPEAASTESIESLESISAEPITAELTPLDFPFVGPIPPRPARAGSVPPEPARLPAEAAPPPPPEPESESESVRLPGQRTAESSEA